MAFQPGAFQFPGFQVQRAAVADAVLPGLTASAIGSSGVMPFAAHTFAWATFRTDPTFYASATDALLSRLTGSAVGEVIYPQGVAAGVLPCIVGDALGALEVTGTGDGSLQSLTGKATGTFGGKRTGASSAWWLPPIPPQQPRWWERPAPRVGAGVGVLPLLVGHAAGRHDEFSGDELDAILAAVVTSIAA